MLEVLPYDCEHDLKYQVESIGSWNVRCGEEGEKEASRRIGIRGKDSWLRALMY